MINNKILVSLLLSVLVVIGWSSMFFANDSEEKEAFEISVKAAEDYFNRGLYQLSIKEYKNALKYKNEKSLWENMFKAYDCRKEEDDEIIEEYIDSVNDACTAVPDNVGYRLRLAELYLGEDDYSSAYEVLNNAEKAQVTSKELDELYIQVKYSYDLPTEFYNKASSFINEEYIVAEEQLYGSIDAEGSEQVGQEYLCLSPLGESGIRLYKSNNDTRLIDSGGVVQGIIKDYSVKNAGIFADGMIPILTDQDKYGYCNSLGDYMFGGFDYAGTFVSDTAAVKKDNRWILINKKGQKVHNEEFEDIVINPDGSYIKDNIIIANDGKGYTFYNEEFEHISEFRCDDIDIYTRDNLIAFCVNKKWGFVDSKGNVKIKPQYDTAKSFSNGLAAVCKDGKWGFINSDAKVVVDYMFSDVDYLNSEGSCMVNVAKLSENENASWGLIKFRLI